MDQLLILQEERSSKVKKEKSPLFYVLCLLLFVSFAIFLLLQGVAILVFTGEYEITCREMGQNFMLRAKY